MIPELQGYALVLRASHRLFHRALEGVTREQSLARRDGANPILWVAAHVVCIRAGFAKGLGIAADVPWAVHFKRGGEVKDEASWPALADVLAAWDAVHEAFMARMETLTAAEVAAETGIPGLDRTLLGALGLAALHDAYHLGQLGAARRLHGLDRLVG